MWASILGFIKLSGKLLTLFLDKIKKRTKMRKEVKDDIEKGIDSRDPSRINRAFGKSKRL